MRPAFTSIKAAAAFALLLLGLLLAPALAGKKFLPPRVEGYASKGWGTGPYPWIQNQIFEETNDIDIVFIGSSHIFNDVNTPYVQDELSKRLGRPAVVRTLAWGGAGYDGLFFIARDLLAHRRVKLLAFYDENPAAGHRYDQMPALFRLGEDAPLLAGLDAANREMFYFAAVMGMPRNLLSLARPNLPAPFFTDKKNYWEDVAAAPNPVTRLGSLADGKGFSPNTALIPAAPFEAYVPDTGVRPADVLEYSAATKSAGPATAFEFSSDPLPAWQVYFCRQLAELFRQHHVRPVMLHLPVLAEAREPKLRERADWPQLFGGDLTLLGIPPAKLFHNVTDAELLKVYADPAHFSRNGQEYFTPLITPALLKIYESTATP